MFLKLERSSSKGYQLYDFGSYWEFHSHKGVFRGQMKQVVTYAVVEFGFGTTEMETAVIEMEKQFHNGAEFGIMRRFMFTFEKKVDQLH